MNGGSLTVDQVTKRFNLNRALVQDLVSRGVVASVPAENGDLTFLPSEVERYAAVLKEQRIERLKLIAQASEEAGLYDL